MKPPRAGANRPLLTRHAALDLDRGTGRLVVVSDTHSRPQPSVMALVAALRPVAILHGGDIGDLSVLDELGRIAPVLPVRGNIDGHANDLPDVLLVDVNRHPAPSLRIFLTHYAVQGTRIVADVARRANEEGASLVVCGHSHVPFLGEDRGLVVFNAGSCGPRRFQLPIVFGTIDITPETVRLQHVSCETGEPWLPPSPAARRRADH